MHPLFIVFFLTVLSFSVTSSPVHAKDFNPVTSAELQTALNDAAGNNEADLITLSDVTYKTSENGNQPFVYDTAENKNLTIRGQGIGQSILDNEAIDGNRVLKLVTTGVNASLTVEDVTIQGGKNALNDGTGIVMDTAGGDVALLNSEIKDNSGVEVIGMDLSSQSGDVTLKGCLVMNNVGTQTTANGVSAHASGKILIEDNIFRNNEASTQAGISAESSSGDLIFNRNLVINNEAVVQDTGGVRLTTIDGTIIFTNNIVAGNTAKTRSGGAFLVTTTGDIFAVNNTIVNNTAVTNGGGITINPDDAANTVIYNNIVYGNTATATMGTDIFIDDIFEVNPKILLFNNIFEELCFDSGGCDPTTLGADEGSNSSDNPLITDIALEDFSLSVGSPAIDAGEATIPFSSLTTTDFAGNVRPFGSDPDIGALEGISELSISPDTVDFGSLDSGTSADEEISLQNSGPVPLEITSLALSGDPSFSLDVNGGTTPCGSETPAVAGESSCTLLVTFTAATANAATGSLDITSNDPNNPVLSVTLSGNTPTNGGGGCSLIR